MNERRELGKYSHRRGEESKKRYYTESNEEFTDIRYNTMFIPDVVYPQVILINGQRTILPQGRLRKIETWDRIVRIKHVRGLQNGIKNIY